MAESPGVNTIRSFKEHPVWLLICERIEVELKRAKNIVFDSPTDRESVRAAGKVRAYETALALPDILLKEAEKPDTIGSKIRRGFR